MRLGGPVFGETSNPDSWAEAVKSHGYSAAYCPVNSDSDEATIDAYVEAAKKADIVIAEVGAWSNPISIDDTEREAALEKCKVQLALADRVGANCCVNISGSRGPKWDGPHPDNLTDDTFDLIVESVRSIIDDVKPTRTFYALETMPWAYPEGPDSYLRLIKAIDRKQCAVHLDPVNIINGLERYYHSGDLIRDCFTKLGAHIKSCHAKDIALADTLTLHLDETRPGLGGLDYATYLRELDRLDPDVPLMLEHLPSAEEYALGAEHIRSIADEVGIKIR
jgi:sugar phosphate isomerase/epimerase